MVGFVLLADEEVLVTEELPLVVLIELELEVEMLPVVEVEVEAELELEAELSPHDADLVIVEYLVVVACLVDVMVL